MGVQQQHVYVAQQATPNYTSSQHGPNHGGIFQQAFPQPTQYAHPAPNSDVMLRTALGAPQAFRPAPTAISTYPQQWVPPQTNIPLPHYTPSYGTKTAIKPSLPKLKPLEGARCLNLVDTESVQDPGKKVEFNGPVIYFCRQVSIGGVKARRDPTPVDCLLQFDLLSDDNICIVDRDSPCVYSEYVDHYISASAAAIVSYAKNNGLDITLSSADKSAFCNVDVMVKICGKAGINTRVQLLWRDIYLEGK